MRVNLRRPVVRTTCSFAAAGLVAVAGAGLATGLAAGPAAAQTPDVGAPLPAHEPTQHARMMPADSPDAVADTATAPGRGLAAAAATAATPAAAATATFQLGLDAASYQHPGGAGIDWRAVASSGRSFAVVKATESSYVNPWLAGDLAGAHAAGLVVGAYAFARPEYSAEAQADLFAASIGPLPAPALPPVLDLETTGGLAPGDLVAWTRAFLARLQSRTGTTPMIYSSPGFWASAMGGSTGFTGYPLWEAHYTAAAAPAAMGGWPTYRLWQFSSTGSIPGIVGAVDEDRFAGSLTDLSTGTVTPAIRSKQQQLGGDLGWLGPASGPEVTVAGGRVQAYRSGSVFWSPATGAHEVHGAVLLDYRAGGGPAGPAGFPITDETGTPDHVGRYNHFANGASVYWSPGSGAHTVLGAVRTEWAATGWERGPLGYPTSDETTAADRVGRYNNFSGGASIFWSPTTGPHEVQGAIRSEWAATGWEHGPLGYPTTDETTATDRVGRYNHFSGGASIFWSPTTGPHEVHGAIRAVWGAAGWQAGAAGYPTSDEYATPTGRAEDFQKAVISWNSTTGAVTVRLR